MELISSHGNRVGISIVGILVVCLCTAAGAYRLKKTAELKQWQKSIFEVYMELKYQVFFDMTNNIIILCYSIDIYIYNY